jgi:hypothetical protein
MIFRDEVVNMRKGIQLFTSDLINLTTVQKVTDSIPYGGPQSPSDILGRLDHES